MKLLCFEELYLMCGFELRGKKCKGGKKSKQQITIACFVGASGKKEKAGGNMEVQKPMIPKEI